MVTNWVLCSDGVFKNAVDPQESKILQCCWPLSHPWPALTSPLTPPNQGMSTLRARESLDHLIRNRKEDGGRLEGNVLKI
ncbi:hypothetical protein CapIbe_001044 [Capra ibex]